MEKHRGKGSLQTPHKEVEGRGRPKISLKKV